MRVIKSLAFAALRRSDNPAVLFGYSQILMGMKTRGIISQESARTEVVVQLF